MGFDFKAMIGTLSVPSPPKSFRDLDNSFSPRTLSLFTPPFLSLCSDQRLQGQRRENQQGRAAPGYEDLDAARRRVLEHDPLRVSVHASGCVA